MKIAGKSMPHESAEAHATGAALYTDDLPLRFPRTLYAWPVLSPHPHATILSIDLTPALTVQGVVTTLCASDVTGENDSGPSRHDEPLFPTVAMHHSQAIVWVLAETLEAAKTGAAKIAVEYEPLPAILTIEQAIAARSFHSPEPVRMRRGDFHSAFASSAVRLEGQISVGGQEQFYLETQNSLAWIDESGGISLHSSTQHPSETQEIVARVLGIPKNRVSVECLRMGGAFGGKESQGNPWAAIAALGAVKTNRPVHVRLPRVLDMVLTGKRHPFLARFEAGFDRRGVLEALRVELYSDGGWSLDLSDPVLSRALFHVDNAYYLKNVELMGYVCKTHKTSQTAFRGFGGPQGMLVIEDILDRAARTLGLAPETVRARNFYRDGQTTHYGQLVKDASRIETIWNQVKVSSRFDERRAAMARFNTSSPHTKRGLAITPVKFGISFTASFFNQAGALVIVYRDGTVQVNHGGTEMGQGLHTKIRQIAAQCLDIPIETVRIMAPRTDKVPNTSATAASSGSDLNGAAVANACEQINERLAPIRASLGPAATFAQICNAAYFQRIPLFAQGFYRTPEIHWDPKTGQGKPFHYYAYGAAVSEVEVDGFTGDYQLRRVDILEDVGNSVSPLIDRGQVEGGFIQGMGWLTIEELLWDSRGRLATNSASTYKLPSWSEVPEIFTVAFLERAAEPGVIFGSKAVGEPPLMLALSVREALRDAIASFATEPSNAPIEVDSPLTPERVYWAIEHVRSRIENAQPEPVESHAG
ncbi:MAG TPA: xanthine dehydrogenase molybdopterin binding subunit [Bryobacteraceae bacterium]|jgi:xanthine dehydrogenase large subunit